MKPRPSARRFAPAPLACLSLLACLAAGDHLFAPPSGAQSRAPVTFEFAPALYRVSEADGGVGVMVARGGGADGRGDLNRAVSVEYQASSGYLLARGCATTLSVGTATPGVDYEMARGTLSFAPGEASKTFRVVVHDDTQIETRHPETVFLSLDFSSEAPPDSDDCFGRAGIIYLHDDDPIAAPTPAPPPTGRRQISFGTNRDGNYEIYKILAIGGVATRLTNTLATELGPAWSPDGRRIAFVGEGDNFGPAVFVMNADGTNVVRLPVAAASASDPAWSPDGRRLAFTGYTNDRSMEIFVVNADGTNLVNLSNNREEDFRPAWSPDGRRIAFTSRRDNGTFSVYVMDADGANVRRAVEGYSRDPAWSPDGSRIAYVAEGAQFGTSIFVVNADGTDKKMLTAAASFVSDVSPAWSPDGAKIAFASTRDGHQFNYEIYSMNADGTNLVRLTNSTAHESLPAWQPGAAAVTAPVLLTETGTNRAVALDSVTFVLDPFTVVSPANLLAADRRTRVALFAANVAHPAAAADISAQAEDSAGRLIQLPVEYVGRVNGFDWLTQVVVRLPDDAATAEHLWIDLNVRGAPTNKAVVTMKTSKQ